QQLGEIAAVEMVVGRAEGRLDLGADRRALQGATIIPASLVYGLRPHACLVQRGLQPQPDQQAGSVGADLDAGADLADARRLLVDVDVEPGFQEMQRSRKPADAAADDCDPHCSTLLHTARPSRHSLPRQATWVSGRTSTSLAS